ncbi:MAG: tetratricopeptide repeat protein [Euryarchaeota archaeon]|nr:tetratricopeptide repeat protein [Euryarchaeota archaeon]
MNTDIRTLKLVVDGFGERHEFLSPIEIPARIDDAVETAVAEIDTDGIDAAALGDRLVETFEDEQFGERVDELAADEEQAVDEVNLLASAVERRADEGSVVDWTTIASTFVRVLQEELVSPDTEAHPSLHTLGTDTLRDGAFDDAGVCLRLSLEIARTLDDRRIEAESLVSLGHLAVQRDDLDTAETNYEAGLDIAREIDGRSPEADSIAGLGTVAISREEYELAETYLEESLDIKRLLEDRSGEATALASLGDLAAERGNYETAIDRYTEARQLFADCGDTSEHIQTHRCLVETEVDRGDEEAAIERCDEALALFESGELSSTDEPDRWFRTTRARLAGDPDAVDSLYAEALGYIREGDDSAAFELLDGLWDCREGFAPGTDPHSRCLRAGVAFAAYHLLLKTDTVTVSQRSIVGEIADSREGLSEPADTLFEFVRSEGADRELRIDTAGVDTTDPPLDDLERLAYAEFLTRITETPPPSELYSSVLTGIVSGDASPEEIVDRCLVALQDDDAVADSRAILGARLLAEAYRELFDFQLPTDRTDALRRIDANREGLSEPLAALFDQLSTESTATDAETLQDAANSSEPSLIDIERLVVARLLDRLQD